MAEYHGGGEHLPMRVDPFDVQADKTPITLDDILKPDYGHYLEDFVVGTVFVHPRGVTVARGMMLDYATTFMEANPLYLNQEFAESQGYRSLPAAPHLVMNLALSLGVQNDSEKAIANLGYYDVRFLCPVYAGDTLTGRTRVIARRDRGVGKPGIVTVQTLAQNQHGDVVVQYTRKIFVPRKGDGPISASARTETTQAFPYAEQPILRIPRAKAPVPYGLTSVQTRFANFRPGQIIVHGNGRTVTDEHVQWTYRVMNTHPLHYDRLYSTGRTGPMSGEPIVYGGLVFAWLLGLASRDTTDNAVWELGFHNGYHTQPTFAGDTICALSRVLGVDARGDDGWGAVRLQLIGVKNISAADALAKHGAELFMVENGKKKRGVDKITDKIFEIERAVLVRK